MASRVRRVVRAYWGRVRSIANTEMREALGSRTAEAFLFIFGAPVAIAILATVVLEAEPRGTYGLLAITELTFSVIGLLIWAAKFVTIPPRLGEEAGRELAKVRARIREVERSRLPAAGPVLQFRGSQTAITISNAEADAISAAFGAAQAIETSAIQTAATTPRPPRRTIAPQAQGTLFGQTGPQQTQTPRPRPRSPSGPGPEHQ